MIIFGKVLVEYGFLSYIFGRFGLVSVKSIFINNNTNIYELNLETIYSDILIEFINKDTTQLMEISVSKNNVKYNNLKPKQTNGKNCLPLKNIFLSNVILESSSINCMINDGNKCIFSLVKIKSDTNRSAYMYRYDDEYFTDRDCYEIIKKIVTNVYE